VGVGNFFSKFGGSRLVCISLDAKPHMGHVVKKFVHVTPPC
jgi:hypothetical protein